MTDGFVPWAILKIDISNKSHTNFFDILMAFKTVFSFNFAKFQKYYPSNGSQTWLICQTTYTYIQN